MRKIWPPNCRHHSGFRVAERDKLVNASAIGCASHSLTTSHLRGKGTPPPRERVYGNNAYAITTIYYLGKSLAICAHRPIQLTVS